MKKPETLRDANKSLSRKTKIKSFFIRRDVLEFFNIFFLIVCIYLVIATKFDTSIWYFCLSGAIYFLYQEIKHDIFTLFKDSRSRK